VPSAAATCRIGRLHAGPCSVNCLGWAAPPACVINRCTRPVVGVLLPRSSLVGGCFGPLSLTRVGSRPYSNFMSASQLDSTPASGVGNHMARCLQSRPYSNYSYGLFSSRYFFPSTRCSAKSCSARTCSACHASKLPPVLLVPPYFFKSATD